MTRVSGLGLDDDDRVEKILGLEYATVFLNEPRKFLTPRADRLHAARPKDACEIRQHAFADLNPAGKSHWTNVLLANIAIRFPSSLKTRKTIGARS
jgi:hypothetical protein